MSPVSGSSFIPVAVFLVILFIVLPVSAGNVTPTATTLVPSQTTVATTVTTAAPSQTPSATTATPVATTIATTQTTPTPVATTVTSPPTTVVTIVTPTPSGVETIATGSVSVYSSPAGAAILIDGVYSGTTPKTVNVVSAGNHILRLELSGYYDYEGSISIVPGEMAQGYGTLQPMNQVTSAEPGTVPTAIIPVILPVVTATPEPTQDPGPLGNTTVLVAIMGAISVLIVAGVSLFIHLTPPQERVTGCVPGP
jgi:hypothetical protein